MTVVACDISTGDQACNNTLSKDWLLGGAGSDTRQGGAWHTVMLGKDQESLQFVYKEETLHTVLGDPRCFLGQNCKLPSQLNNQPPHCLQEAVRLFVCTGLWVRETLET